MPKLFCLDHVMRYGPGDAWTACIGVYDTAHAAEGARLRALGRPGFRTGRGIFQLRVCDIDATYWPGGLESQPYFILPTKADLPTSEPFGGDTIYILSNMSDVDPDAAEHIIGLYSSKETADRALDTLRRDPELGAAGRIFNIDRFAINEDHWTSGFSAYDPAAS